MKTKWNVRHRLKSAGSSARLEELLEVLLHNRGISSAGHADFLHPPHPDTIALTDLGVNHKQLKRAVELILRLTPEGWRAKGPRSSARSLSAWRRGRRSGVERDRTPMVVIYGDYDADGITATAILYESLTAAGVNVWPFIPDRQKHGYGLSKPGLTEVIDKHHPDLIIAVDNGITAIDATKFAQNQGVKTIVIDHHQPLPGRHPAAAVVHSTQASGAGLAWLFSVYLSAQLNQNLNTANTLELAAIGTVADMVPLVGANRSLAAHGLTKLQTTARPGVKHLIQIAGLNQAEIDTHHLGFHLAPRLNASGRLENAMDSLRLLCTTDPGRAARLAADLNRTNRLRQDLTDSLFQTAAALVPAAEKPHPIVVSHPDFHEGVIGLVAGKLAQQFWRPAVVISQGKIFSKASARSIPGFNIIDVLRQIDKLMESCGGHPQAAGFSIRTEKIAEFIDSFTKISRPLLTPDILSRNLNIDAAIDFPDISPQLLDVQNLLKPTGIGNPSPTFSTANLIIRDLKSVGKDFKHLRLILDQNGIKFPAIGFGLGNLAASLSPHKSVSAAYTPFLSTFNGNTQIELKVKDLKPY